MPPESTRGNIRAGDVSGTFIVGDNNHVTSTTHEPEQQQPQQSQQEAQSQQRNSASDQAAVFAVENGHQYVTYYAGAEREGED
ncbi:hypothetical protein [Streptomyces sp. NPDC008125]|uniref:hypothetical protein n=1 Tax=Streptomyces sp. NPDC008125 TaxID=3364811 RepID=UPI0036F0F7C3